MKISVDTKKLKAALGRMTAIPGLNGPSALSIGYDEFDGLTLRRNTHLASIKIELEADIEGEGTVCVSFDSLNALSGRLNCEKLVLEADKSKLNVKAGSSAASLVLWPDKEISPDLPDVEAGEIEFDSCELLAWLTVADMASFRQEGKDNMKGVCVRTFNGNVSIIGTDGRRFHYLIGPEAFEPVLLALDESGAETGFDKGILIGREMLAVIQRMLSDDEGKCKLRVSRQCAEVESFGRSVKFAISNDGPPDISKLVEGATYSIECVVDRLRMLKIVMTAAPLGAGESLAITIHYVKGAVRVEADDSRGNTFVDEFPANPSRVNVAFRVSANYMIDFLKASNLEEIAIGYQKDFHMLMFREDDRFITVALMRDNTIPKELNPY